MRILLATDGSEHSEAAVDEIARQHFPADSEVRVISPIINLLGGLNVRVNESLHLGFAFQVPVTSRKDFSSQMVFQPDIEWRRAR